MAQEIPDVRVRNVALSFAQRCFDQYIKELLFPPEAMKIMANIAEMGMKEEVLPEKCHETVQSSTVPITFGEIIGSIHSLEIKTPTSTPKTDVTEEPNEDFKSSSEPKRSIQPIPQLTFDIGKFPTIARIESFMLNLEERNESPVCFFKAVATKFEVDEFIRRVIPSLEYSVGVSLNVPPLNGEEGNYSILVQYHGLPPVETMEERIRRGLESETGIAEFRTRERPAEIKQKYRSLIEGDNRKFSLKFRSIDNSNVSVSFREVYKFSETPSREEIRKKFGCNMWEKSTSDFLQYTGQLTKRVERYNTIHGYYFEIVNRYAKDDHLCTIKIYNKGK